MLIHKLKIYLKNICIMKSVPFRSAAPYTLLQCCGDLFSSALNFFAGNRYILFMFRKFVAQSYYLLLIQCWRMKLRLRFEEIEPYVCVGSLMLSHGLELDSVGYGYMWFIYLSYNTSLLLELQLVGISHVFYVACIIKGAFCSLVRHSTNNFFLDI